MRMGGPRSRTEEKYSESSEEPMARKSRLKEDVCERNRQGISAMKSEWKCPSAFAVGFDSVSSWISTSLVSAFKYVVCVVFPASEKIRRSKKNKRSIIAVLSKNTVSNSSKMKSIFPKTGIK